MIIRQNDDFFIEHGESRRGYFNARMHVTDAGMSDSKRSLVYKIEAQAEARFSSGNTIINSPIRHYNVAGIIDYIVTQDDYVKWFGGTHLLVMFNQKLVRSRAMRDCIELADHKSCGIAWFDIYHELAHSVTISNEEPHHGERFIAAMILIASLSPFKSHGSELAKRFRKAGLYPTAKYFVNVSYV